jgi:archaellum biogenesis ATPase FlaH
LKEIDALLFEDLLIRYLFDDLKFRDRVYPFLKIDIFEKFENKEIVKKIFLYYGSYNKFPNIKEMKIIIEDKNVYEQLVKCFDIDLSEYSKDFIFNEIEGFFKSKLIYSELINGVTFIKDGDVDKVNSVADKLMDYLSFSFDTKIGLDPYEDKEDIYQRLHTKDKVVPSGLLTLDSNIGGGFHEKTLNLFLAPTHMGKTLIKCSLAVNSLLNNKNVLYITCEMSELEIFKRIISNMFDIPINDLVSIPKENFFELFDKFKKFIQNKLIIKEYPTGTLTSRQIRSLIKEIKNKKKFVPDIIYIDYIGIMKGNGADLYTSLKNITEEVRGVSVEFEIPIVSSVQANREGTNTTSLDFSNTAESMGIPRTADVMLAVTQSDEFKQLKKFRWSLLKNRYGECGKNLHIGVVYEKMRVHDIDKTKNLEGINKDELKSATENILDVVKNDRKQNVKKNMGISLDE